MGVGDPPGHPHYFVAYRLLLSHLGGGGGLRHMVKHFPRYLITTSKPAVKTEPIRYLGRYMPNCPVPSCAKEPIYMRQNSMFIFYINTFQRN